MKRKTHNRRPLHLEPLEERQMLSVSAAEFNQIPALYTSQNLADYENYSRNEAANLTGESLQGAMAHL